MSLSTLMTALIEYVGDVIVNDCGRPIPDRLLSYQGVIPDDCCSESGLLAASWADGRPVVKFPAQLASSEPDVCAAAPVYTISIRYRVCWPVPELNDDGIEVNPVQDAKYNEVASMLADVADCVARELISLSCVAGGSTPDPFAQAVLDNVSPRKWLRYVDAQAERALGGCTGVTWRVYAAPSPGPGVS